MSDSPPLSVRHRTGLRSPWTWLVFALLVAGVLYGAGRLAFLCDDAYIYFRYVANARDGHGLVWNPPPFAPVEGYTGFLWAIVLWAAWSWFGVEPPDAVQPIAMACGIAQLCVVGLALLRLRDRAGARVHGGVVTAALLVVAVDRTFLQWLSGGLETALFNLGFVAWVALACRRGEPRPVRWWSLWSFAAVGTALTRPDGLLLVAATAATAVVSVARDRAPRRLLGLAPLLAVVAHAVWRRWFYGEWLPNTYHAKVVTAWPEAGWRYLAGFAVEHGAWLWLAIAVLWLAVELRRRGARAARDCLAHLPVVAATATTLVHLGYYVLVVGGDHFEYRVFSHLVPLGALSAAAMLVRTFARPLWQGTALVALAAASAFGWLQLVLTADQPRAVPWHQPIADRLPGWALPFGRWYDRNQAWLQYHYVCCRCPQHALTLAQIRELLPPERTWIGADPADLPILKTPAAGVPGWVLPDTNVLDLFGLNDWVTARAPIDGPPFPPLPRDAVEALARRADADGDGVLAGAELPVFVGGVSGRELGPDDGAVDLFLRLFAVERADALTFAEAVSVHGFFAELRFMAHERRSPPGYVDALDPNVVVEGRRPVVRPRAEPMTPARLRAIEHQWRQRVTGN